MNYKLYQPVWVAFPDSQAPVIGVVLKPGQHGCIVAAPATENSYSRWVAPSDALAPATDEELAAQPDWVRAHVQHQVVTAERTARQEVG
jgi:hypothetical protein